MNRLIAVGISLILFLSACTPDKKINEWIITDVSVVDIEQYHLLENRDVVINDGKIQRIGQDLDAMADSVIDGSGKFLIPGLWDMHVHFRGGDSLISENKHLLNLFIANGITGVRDAGGDITTAILDWKSDIEEGELVGPKIFTSGPKLDGPNPGWPGSIALQSPEEVPAAFDSLESLNVDYVKLYDSSISRGVYLSAISEAEKRGLPVTGHMPFTVRFREAVEEGLDATEHMYYVLKGTSSKENQITDEIISRNNTDDPLGFWEALPRIFSSYDEETARETFALMKKHNTAAVPTLHIGEVLAYMTERNHKGDEYLNYIGPGIMKTYDRRLNAARNSSDEARRRRRNLQEKFVALTGDLHEAGVTILAGSDSGPFNSFTYPGISLHRELEALVTAGLSPAEALKSATINGAAFFDLQGEFGQVKEGFAADLLLLNGNPLEDIRNTKDIHSLLLRGNRLIRKAELKQMLLRGGR